VIHLFLNDNNSIYSIIHISEFVSLIENFVDFFPLPPALSFCGTVKCYGFSKAIY
jgi:hypothetical protein